MRSRFLFLLFFLIGKHLFIKQRAGIKQTIVFLPSATTEFKVEL
ncbi:Uncharacterised protein [Vibrio cholerae]|nr:Uncharacterised protein [Vibrio cholerae]